jgi:hypothetical protein
VGGTCCADGGDGKYSYIYILSESCMEDNSLGNVSVDGWIILNWILKSRDVWAWTRLN